jgi:hypothetical protein
MKKKSSLVIAILLILFGIFCFYWGVIFVQANSANWPSVQGKVTSAKVDSSSNSSTDSTDYYVTVGYEYAVGEIKNASSFKTGSRSTHSDAEADLAKYAPGSEIAVFYDPKDPNSSTTSPGEIEFLGAVGLAAGLFFAGSGAWSFRAYFKPEKTPPQDGLATES